MEDMASSRACVEYSRVLMTKMGKTCCNMQYLYSNVGKQHWASRVTKLLFSGFFSEPEVWYNQGVGDVNMFLSQFSQRIRDINI
jgi:hypothetical protein